MSVLITRTAIKSYFNSGDVPTEAQFSAFIDAFPMVYNETVTLAIDTDLTITHGTGENARIVQVVDSDGKSIGVNWRRDPSDPTNKVIINSGKAYTDAEVSILTK
jgi:hypothetical protein